MPHDKIQIEPWPLGMGQKLCPQLFSAQKVACCKFSGFGKEMPKWPAPSYANRHQHTPNQVPNCGKVENWPVCTLQPCHFWGIKQAEPSQTIQGGFFCCNLEIPKMSKKTLGGHQGPLKVALGPRQWCHWFPSGAKPTPTPLLSLKKGSKGNVWC